MKVVNAESLGSENSFLCYSPNFYIFLKYIKKIEPIYIGYDKSKHKKFSVFFRSDELEAAIKEWRNNKKEGTLAINKKAK